MGAYRKKALVAKMMRDGVVDVYLTQQENLVKNTEEFRQIVREWPISRIAALKGKCALPTRRLCALLGISQTAYSKLSAGVFTPSPALCRRMQIIEDQAEKGEIHRNYFPNRGEMQRRLCLFRAWWLSRPPTTEYPLITLRMRLSWGKGKNSIVDLPEEGFLKVRLSKPSGLPDVIKAVTVAIRKLSRANTKELWKVCDQEFWDRYARDTLPKIIMESAKITDRRQSVRTAILKTVRRANV